MEVKYLSTHLIQSMMHIGIHHLFDTIPIVHSDTSCLLQIQPPLFYCSGLASFLCKMSALSKAAHSLLHNSVKQFFLILNQDKPLPHLEPFFWDRPPKLNLVIRGYWTPCKHSLLSVSTSWAFSFLVWHSTESLSLLAWPLFSNLVRCVRITRSTLFGEGVL